MPRYDFKNLKTGEVDEYTMSWKELDKFKEDNPDLQQVIGAVNHNYNSGGSATLNTSDAFGTIANGYGSEVKRNSGQLIFLENRDPINRSSSQIEDIKLIVEF
jgi:hypothetical protein